MKRRRYSCFVKLIACVIAIVLFVPYPAGAAVQETVTPLASDYLMSYTSYIGHVGDGKLEIWFRVTGTGRCADLGVLTIQLFESTNNSTWTWVKTYRHTDYPQMLAQDEWQNMSYVEYEGSVGKYYKAYVTIWGGDETTGDARYIWTEVEYASPN